MAVYFITQFSKSQKHRKGAINKDLQQIDGNYPNITEALRAMAKLMDTNRFPGHLRLDRNVKFNAIAYSDLDEFGGVIRFRKPDNFHFYPQIPLSELKRRLANKR